MERKNPPRRHDHSYALPENPIVNEKFPERFQMLNHNILCFMKEQKIPGAALALCYHGNLVYTQGFGQAGPGTPVLSSSKFRLASISKPVTACVVMAMVQRGLMQLDSLVFGKKGLLSEYRPRAKGDKRLLKVTVRHLLQHSAGWDRDMVGDQVFWNLDKVIPMEMARSRQGLLHYIMSRKLQFSPGKRHSYSNLGYMVLGMLIEKVSGMSYVDCIHDYLGVNADVIFEGQEKKQDLHDMEVCYYDNRESGVLPSVVEGDGQVEPQYGSFAMKDTGSYGGLVSSAVDLLLVMEHLLNSHGSVLSQNSITCMLEPPTYTHGNTWYGLGLDVQAGGHSWGHTGAMEGTSCTWLHHQSGLAWTFLLNAWSRDLDLDGLLKYSLSQVPGMPVYNPQLTSLRFDGTALLQEGTKTLICSHDSLQSVHVLLALSDLDLVVQDMQHLRYIARQINMVVMENSLFVNIIWEKNSDNTLWEMRTLVVANGDELAHSGGTILCLDTCFLDSRLHCVYVLENVQGAPQKVLLGIEGGKFVEHMAAVKRNGWQIIIQSVAIDTQQNLHVTAVFKKTSLPGNNVVSWLQISMENFMYELVRQSRQGLGLQYLKVFVVREETYVSAVWSNEIECNKCFHRTDVSRFGFLYEICQSCHDNLRVSQVNSYMSEGVLNFACVWLSDE